MIAWKNELMFHVENKMNNLKQKITTQKLTFKIFQRDSVMVLLMKM